MCRCTVEYFTIVILTIAIGDIIKEMRKNESEKERKKDRQ